MSQTYNRCNQVSLESVTLTHWGWSFTFLLLKKFLEIPLLSLQGFGAHVLFCFFFFVKKRHPRLRARGCRDL
jgi:hypothetical protein